MNETWEDLIAWLRQQIDQDALWAREASRRDDHYTETGEHWHWVCETTDQPITIDPVINEYVEGHDHSPVDLRSVEEYPCFLGRLLPHFIIWQQQELQSVAAIHIARHDPARVLLEVKAKREMIAAVERFLNPHPGQPCTNENTRPFEACELHVARMDTAITPYALKLLALPYADRTGYRTEWDPS